MSKTLKQRGNEGKYINLSAYVFIKWLANHRGGHAFEMKACAAKWINHAEIKRRALRELAEEFSQHNVELCQPCPPLTPPPRETAAGQGLA